MLASLIPRSVCFSFSCDRNPPKNIDWRFADIEDVSQKLIEDNIVAVSRQMIDKEASVARQSFKEDTNGAAMEVDEDL